MCWFVPVQSWNILMREAREGMVGATKAAPTSLLVAHHKRGGTCPVHFTDVNGFRAAGGAPRQGERFMMRSGGRKGDRGRGGSRIATASRRQAGEASG